ncbi:MAG: glycosyltransferase family 4 protein [Candidatus Omnitrophica bacterium]|nr:glycosyltransferase family 4 protein [Candidatus Omnitrophota bacterium]MDD5488977.1 glycosyltransferase family 4 protein [Candidatus Omnitrophota bacterium]
MRILYVLPRRKVGGIKQTEDVFISAVKKLSPGEMEFFYCGSFTDRDNFLFRFVTRFADWVRFDLKCLMFRPDIVHFNSSFDWMSVSRDIFFALTARALNVRFVLKAHGSNREFLSGMKPFWRWLGRTLIRLSDVVCVGTNAEKKEFMKCFDAPDHKYRVMKNAVDIRDFPKKEEDSVYFSHEAGNLPRVLYLSRLVREKGIYDFLDAIPPILREKEMYFYVGGFGEERGVVENMIKEKGLEGNVFILPFLDEATVKRIYHYFDIFVFPTHCAEGIPVSLLNAIVCGTPVVTTRFRFAMDYMKDPDNCLFVEKGTPGDIASKVLFLEANRDIAGKMRTNNSTLGKIFDKKMVALEYMDIYNGEDNGS